MNSHKFETQIAIDYDVETALLLETLSFWIGINITNRSHKHYHDGRWWLFNSYNSWTELFPYYSAKQMRRILSNAESNGLIIIGNYNKRSSDLTKWYSLTDKSLCYFPFLKDRFFNTPAQTGKTPAQTGKTPAQTGNALPDPNPDPNPGNNKDINARDEKDFDPTIPLYIQCRPQNQGQQLQTNSTGKNLSPVQSDTFEKFWELYPRKSGKPRAQAQWFHDGCHLIADQIIKKLKEQIKRDKSFLDGCIPNPHKYIVEQRYNDDIFESKKSHFDYQDKSWALKSKRDIFDELD